MCGKASAYTTTQADEAKPAKKKRRQWVTGLLSPGAVKYIYRDADYEERRRTTGEQVPTFAIRVGEDTFLVDSFTIRGSVQAKGRPETGTTPVYAGGWLETKSAVEFRVQKEYAEVPQSAIDRAKKAALAAAE